MASKKIILLSFLLHVLILRGQVRTAAFGSGNYIRYDLHAGTYDVVVGGKKVIGDAYALCGAGQPGKGGVVALQAGGILLDSRRGYTRRSWSADRFTDGKGRGTRYSIRLTGGGQAGMEQLFYIYDGGAGFFTEVAAAGIACDYMSPLSSAHVAYDAASESRVLRVPFDNDGWVRYDGVVLPCVVSSSEVTAIYEDKSHYGMILGSVDHHDWKTGIDVEAGGELALRIYGGYTDKAYTRDMKRHGRVGTGLDGYCRSPRMMVGWFADWRRGMEEYGAANRRLGGRYVAAWKQAKPFGWNSWGAMQTGLSPDRARAVVDFFHDSCQAFRNGDNTLYIDLDSYWDNLLKGGMMGDYSELEAFCRYCRSRGFVPGIYWAPFVDWGKTERAMEDFGRGWRYEDCWLRVNGGYIDLDGARAMDPTHPGTKARIAFLMERFRRCGFGMIKIDFLGHATLEADHYYDTTVHTGMQAFRKGMEYLIDQMHGEMLVYAAISPNLATGRYAHMRRIACDAYHDIGETSYTLNSVTYGWWQGQLYDYIDADHVVFSSGPAGVNRARLVSALVTGTLITGDDYSVAGPWRDMAKRLLQDKGLLEIACGGHAFRPLEGNVGEGASHAFYGEAGGRAYLAVFNYSDTAMSYGIDPRVWKQEVFSGMKAPADGAIRIPPADVVIFRN